MTLLEKALVAAAKEFLKHYSAQQPSAPSHGYGDSFEEVLPEPGKPPTCRIHVNRPMRLGNYGYHCTAKLEDGTYCRQKIKN